MMSSIIYILHKSINTVIKSETQKKRSEKAEGKRLLCRPTRKREDDIKVDL